jgi:hypothetical protein
MLKNATIFICIFQFENASLLVFVSLEAVREEWLLHAGPYHIRDAIRHYGVFQHVFGGIEFVPEVDLRVAFEGDHVVNRGNFIGPSQCLKPPTLQFNHCVDNSLWTVVLTNPGLMCCMCKYSNSFQAVFIFSLNFLSRYQ